MGLGGGFGGRSGFLGILDTPLVWVYDDTMTTTKGTTMTIKETLTTATNHQWEEWDTGGGCTALVLNFDADNYIMLTDEGCMIPSTADENLMVGLYANGDDEGEIYYVSNLTDALPIISNMIKQVQE